MFPCQNNRVISTVMHCDIISNYSSNATFIDANFTLDYKSLIIDYTCKLCCISTGDRIDTVLCLL